MTADLYHSAHPLPCEGRRPMTRDDARDAFQAARLRVTSLSTGSVQSLKELMDAQMRLSGLMGGTFRIRKPIRVRGIGVDQSIEIFCRSRHFKSREAVTFYPDYYIGFAGWADDINVQPILAAFVEWVETMSSPANGGPDEATP